MPINVSYRNLKENVITPQQKDNLQDYYELIFENNFLKKKLLYFDNKISMGDYFLSPNEDITSLLPQLCDASVWFLHKDPEIINGYNIWKVFYYRNSGLSSAYEKRVYNPEGKTIASISFNDNGTPSGSGVKTLIVDGDLEFTFYFENDGIIKIDTPMEFSLKPYHSVSLFLEDHQDGYLESILVPKVINYFTNLLPVVPNF